MMSLSLAENAARSLAFLWLIAGEVETSGSSNPDFSLLFFAWETRSESSTAEACDIKLSDGPDESCFLATTAFLLPAFTLLLSTISAILILNEMENFCVVARHFFHHKFFF
jgi:hypothetical protein